MWSIARGLRGTGSVGNNQRVYGDRLRGVWGTARELGDQALQGVRCSQGGWRNRHCGAQAEGLGVKAQQVTDGVLGRQGPQGVAREFGGKAQQGAARDGGAA